MTEQNHRSERKRATLCFVFGHNNTFTMTADEFRKLALEIPGAVEQSHMNHPDFRLHGKIFASLGAPDDNWGMVKLTPEQQSTFIRRAPRMFRPCNGAWGRQGSTNVLLEAANETVVRSAIAAAAGNMQAHAPKRKKLRIRTHES